MKKVKICGLFRKCDIEAVNESKPDYAGFIINFPKSHRNISIELLKELTSLLDGGIKAVGVFVDEDVNQVADLINKEIINIPQLHGHEDESYIKRLRELIKPGIPIWQAVQIKSEDDIQKANASNADFIILDAGQGSGTQFEWSCLSRITREYGLAGGINFLNVDEACETNASVLDISGGVETDKLKDPEKISKMVSKVKTKKIDRKEVNPNI